MDDASFRAHVQQRFPEMNAATTGLLQRTSASHGIPLRQLIKAVRQPGDRSPSPTGAAGQPTRDLGDGRRPSKGCVSPEMQRRNVPSANSVVLNGAFTTDACKGVSGPLHTKRHFDKEYHAGEVCWREGAQGAQQSFERMCLGSDRGGYGGVVPVPRLSTRTSSPEKQGRREANPNESRGDKITWEGPSTTANPPAGQAPQSPLASPRRLLRSAGEGGQPVTWRTGGTTTDMLKWDQVPAASPPTSPRIGGRRHLSPVGHASTNPFCFDGPPAVEERRMRRYGSPAYSISSNDHGVRVEPAGQRPRTACV